MATTRTYHDSCGVAHALELIGERWALLVVRELMLGAKRFGDIKDGLPGISANVLSHRLDELTQAGLVTRRKLPKPAVGLGLRPDAVGPRPRTGHADHSAAGPRAIRSTARTCTSARPR